MNTSELKLDLFKKLESLKGDALKEAYGIVLNYINSNNKTEDWSTLTDTQQKALLTGVHQLDKGEGKDHEEVIDKMRRLL